MEIDKLALVSIKSQKVLMTRSKNKSLFYLPGGKRENGESDIQALKRESEEEIMVVLKDSSIKYMNTFTAQADGKPDGINVKMTCYFADYLEEPTPQNEIAEIKWMDMSHYAMIAQVDKIIFTYLKDQSLIV